MIDKPIKDLTPAEREQVIQEMKETATPEEWESITQLAKWIGDAGAWLRMANYYTAVNKFEDPDTIKGFFTTLREFLPILIEELEKDPDVANLKASELSNSDVWQKVVDRAAKRMGETDYTPYIDKDTDGESLPNIRYKKGTELKTSTDKLANIFFSLAAPKGRISGSGQREMIPLKYERNNQSKEITLFYDYSFNDEVMKKFGLPLSFDSYDYFVAAVCDNLFLEGNTDVSLTKIWSEMDDGSSPNTKHLTELYESLVKGATTTVFLDDREVREAWGVNTGDTYNEIVSPVMPLQILGEKFKANGNVANARIVINNVSPFFALSYSLGHYSTWSKDVLKLYKGKRTKRFWSVFHYLMTQIGWMRNPSSDRSNKITYNALYAYTGAKSTRDKQLTRNMTYRVLDEVFKPAGYVISYKEDSKGAPGIIIRYTKNTAAALPNAKN